MANFLRQSFFIPKPPLTEKNLPDQHGKVFIVTGANAGLGYQLTSVLYSQNATVYLAGRSSEKCTAAISTLQKAHPTSKGRLEVLKLDLADLSTIKASANDFLAREDRLDVLWNNAGIMWPPLGTRSAQDFEIQFGTNILGPFLFTKLLYPILKHTSENAPKDSVRVCWAGSAGIDVQSPKGGITMSQDGSSPVESKKSNETNYAMTKVANYWLGYEFARRHSDDNILSNSFNPGNLKTELQRHARASYPAFVWPIMDFLMLYPARFGAYTELYAGLSKDLTVAKNNGKYIWPWGREGGVRRDVQDGTKTKTEGGSGKADILWEWCEKETGRFA